MTYRTVFDVAEAGYRNAWFPAFGLVFVAVGIGLVIFRQRLGGGKLAPRVRTVVSFGFLAFAILWTAISFGSTWSDYLALRDDLHSGKCSVVEGAVTDFVPMPSSGHGEESFVVAGEKFTYSDNVVRSGFNQTSRNGGPIRAGLVVRIHFRRKRIQGNEIARLEVAE